VILMDVRMPGMNGIEATTRLVQAGSCSRILMLTTFNLDEYVYHALKAGASGFLLKDAISEATVKSHIARILAKLGLRDRVQVAVYASGLAR
jgi:DNA-binding NarL/FixJ family response regulator